MKSLLFLTLFGFMLSLSIARVDYAVTLEIPIVSAADDSDSDDSDSDDSDSDDSDSDDSDSDDSKVYVCHITGGSSSDDIRANTLYISSSAEAAHLAHGDIKGQCPSTPTCFYCDDSASSQGDGSCVCPNGNPGTLVSNPDESGSEFSPTNIRAVQGD